MCGSDIGFSVSMSQCLCGSYKFSSKLNIWRWVCFVYKIYFSGQFTVAVSERRQSLVFTEGTIR